MAEPVGGPPEPPAQLHQVQRGAVGQGRIGLVPDMLSRIKLWRVGQMPQQGLEERAAFSFFVIGHSR